MNSTKTTSSTKTTNPFEVLGLDEAASDEEIKKAYFQGVRQFTPEKHAEQFKQIREAYDLLKDPSKRLEAEVFGSIRPSIETVDEVSELPPIELKADDLLEWARSNLLDLERTDFRDDFNNVF